MESLKVHHRTSKPTATWKFLLIHLSVCTKDWLCHVKLCVTFLLLNSPQWIEPVTDRQHERLILIKGKRSLFIVQVSGTNWKGKQSLSFSDCWSWRWNGWLVLIFSYKFLAKRLAWRGGPKEEGTRKYRNVLNVVVCFATTTCHQPTPIVQTIQTTLGFYRSIFEVIVDA